MLLYIVQSVRSCVRGVFEILWNTLFLMRHLFVPMERENGGETQREGGRERGRDAGKERERRDRESEKLREGERGRDQCVY